MDARDRRVVHGRARGRTADSIPGSSDVVLGGVVAYANAVKEAELGVPASLLAEHGAVSAEAAAAMAAGVRERLGADVGISVTGIAGPGGGTPEKPVGLVYIHVSTPESEDGLDLQIPGDRDAIRGAGDGGRAAPRAAPSDTEPAHSRMTPAGSVEGHVRPRLFVALRLPGDVVERLVAWQARLPDADARLVPPENLHMTVAFLGARPARGGGADRARAARGGGGDAAIHEFDVRDYRETRSVGMVRFADR